MLCVDCMYIYVNKFEARSLFSTSCLKQWQHKYMYRREMLIIKFKNYKLLCVEEF